MIDANGKKIVIIGATSCIAEHCARLWAGQSPSVIVLVGRNQSKIGLVASDLGVRSPRSDIEIIETDFVDPVKIKAIADQINVAGQVDIVLVAHGWLPDQQDCQENLGQCREALEINAISPVLFAEAFAGHMETAGKGILAIIGSVAGDRGRKTNYVYGAAKGLIDRYAQGLRHRLAKTGVKVVLVKPGPTETPMTAHFKEQGVRLASAHVVAENIVNGIARGKLVIYSPSRWSVIMLAVQHLPDCLFNRLNV